MKTALYVLALLVTPTLAGAQRVNEIYAVDSPACCGGEYAASLDGGRDVDGDGIGDVLVGAPGASGGGHKSGRAFLYSGVDGSLLATFDGEAAHDDFGKDVSFVDDLDGDAVPDVVVGAPLHDAGWTNDGKVYVYSGASGLLLSTVTGGGTDQAQLGVSVAGIGDVDGDGAGDVLVGAPGLGGGGIAHLYSGAGLAAGQGAAAWVASQTPIVDNGECCMRFGESVADLGDVDGDGTGDYGVGAYQDGDADDQALGAAYVYSGASHGLLGAFHGNEPWERFGIHMAGDCDLNADGFDDVIVGATPCSTFIDPQPYVRVLSGAAIAGYGGPLELYTLRDPSTGCTDFGAAADGIGDLDGDGKPELAVGAPFDDKEATNSGGVWIFSGRTGHRLLRLRAEPAAEGFGAAVTRAGDLDGNGIPDVLVGAPEANPNGGAWRAFSIRTRRIDPTDDHAPKQ